MSARNYRYDEKRKNIPPAKIAAEGRVPLVPKQQYSYSPRLDPVLRFDSSGERDRLPELLNVACQRALTSDEAQLLAEALRTQEPWLEWAGKRESKRFEVDPVALHIHERVSAQAILKIAARQDIARDLFADPKQDYHQAVQFYQHDIDWANRIILGDSLQVMSSLALREDLAGQVKMIYMDPPYGIRFGSNFQTEIGNRDVKDRDANLTREPEMVRAYRDTWTLGVHSYASYLRERFIVARNLLNSSGSIFVQISDENLSVVRLLLDEVFGRANFCSQISFSKAAGGLRAANRVGSVLDYILWYAKDLDAMDYYPIYEKKSDWVESGYTQIEESSGLRRSSTKEERLTGILPDGAKPFMSVLMTKPGPGSKYDVEYQGRNYNSGKRWWGTTPEGLNRVLLSERVVATENSIRFVNYFDDFPYRALTNLWSGFGGAANPQYVVQTNPEIIKRCMLMVTQPGDLVLDPTCGGGTTAYVAEQWGRRWILIDTSRVAVAIARQRLLTSQFDYYELREPGQGIQNGLKYKTASHITLRSFAQNQNLDPIFSKHQVILDKLLAACNAALPDVDDSIRQKLNMKLIEKTRSVGKRGLTEADQRRWSLPKSSQSFEHWTVPYDTDSDWPTQLTKAVQAYRLAWRAKVAEVNECVARSADPEELFDQPELNRAVIRVSGPFTVEAVQPPEVSLGELQESPIGGDPDELEDTFPTRDGDIAARNTEAYIDQMLKLLRIDGVRFPDNKQMNFTSLEPIIGKASVLHAEGSWASQDQAEPDQPVRPTIAVAFGPQYGPVTAHQVEHLIRAAARAGYDDLVIAGFNFDGPAQAVIEESAHPNVRIHMAHIRPDVNPGMDGLLKQQPGAQLFTVFGLPRTVLNGPDRNQEYTVDMEGVDIYNPVDNTVTPSRADKVAAWFVDSDYDGRTFCITQAFFPDRSAWAKLSKALDKVVDESRFEALSGTRSLPFPVGENKAVAVKVLDPRGNEVMRVHRLGNPLDNLPLIPIA